MDSGKRLVHSSYGLKPGTVSPKIENRLTSVSADSSRDVHDVLNHGADAATLYASPNRSIVLAQAFLPHDAEQVVSEHPRVQNQIVGIEFAGGQSLQIQIRLQLTMKLFARAVIAG